MAWDRTWVMPVPPKLQLLPHQVDGALIIKRTCDKENGGVLRKILRDAVRPIDVCWNGSRRDSAKLVVQSPGESCVSAAFAREYLEISVAIASAYLVPP